MSDSENSGSENTSVDPVVMPCRVWKKMTPEEYAWSHETFGKHVAISQEIVEGCQEVWVYLGRFIEFQEA